MAEKLFFRLLTPMGEVFSCTCDGVDLTAKDDASGHGGGSLGIRRGHLPAAAALEEGGVLRCVSDGRTVFSCRVRGGFARVSREEVTVLTPEAAEVWKSER